MGGYCESKGPAIGSQASFKILSGTAGIPHFFSSSAVLLQWRSKFWKLAWEPIAAYFWSKWRTQLEISVSKMGFMLPDLKNHSKSVKTFRLKNGKSWCLANEHFFCFFVLLCFVCIGSSMNPSMVRKKLNVHAARDGTAAGRYGGAPREHLIFLKKLYLVCFWFFWVYKVMSFIQYCKQIRRLS